MWRVILFCFMFMVACKSNPLINVTECASGWIGNGRICVDLDECNTAHPCYKGVVCTNLNPGYTCDACPDGLKGPSVSGVGYEFAVKNKQKCEDINECTFGSNGGCVPNSICINTEGSFFCGPCRAGYYGSQELGCQSNICTSGSKCSMNSACRAYNSYTPRQCFCNIGYAGDGKICNADKDLDGFPNEEIFKCNSTFCYKDNCVNVPNSGQEDADGDGVGDACDEDADKDGVMNEEDNCPLKDNSDQNDEDGDNIGDECDNCPSVSNPDQIDSDKDGDGDACDSDKDNDGILNEKDNCDIIKNHKQFDYDGDKRGDLCDNCPDILNYDQKDSDEDFIGDACDNNKDRDRDGIQDSFDNCPDVPNGDQIDSDWDGFGDKCDEDMDNDGIPNSIDNCRLIYNPLQTTSKGGHVGVICQFDFDGDNVHDNLDNCPENSKISKIDFRNHQVVNLDTGGLYTPPKWSFTGNGSEILETKTSASLFLGLDYFSGVDYEGTFYVNDRKHGSDFIGFVFGYQSIHRFYAVLWKKKRSRFPQTIKDKAIVATPGMTIKLVNSTSGNLTSSQLLAAIWNLDTTKDEVKLLWKDPHNITWKFRTAYRWFLWHRPSIGVIRIMIYHESNKLIDSGNIYDDTLKGGRIGVFTFSQPMVTWAHLVYKCNELIPADIYYHLPIHTRKNESVIPEDIQHNDYYDSE